MQKYRYSRLFFCVLFFILSSCHSIGPTNINTDRSHYNDVVWQTDLEQLLKNIVRLRYAESSSYFQVTNVTASYSLVQSASAQIVTPASTLGYYPTLTASPSVVYSDSPTISYAPLGNAAFIASLEKPVDFQYFLLLSHGCRFDFDMLAKTTLSKIGPLSNSPSATSISVYEIPHHEKYYLFVNTISNMIKNHQVIPQVISVNNTLGIMLQFVNKNSSDALLAKKLVQVPASNDNITILPEGEAIIVTQQNGQLIIPNYSKQWSNVVFAQTRSIDGILTFLSHSVKVPYADIQNHFSVEGYTENQSVYDWDLLMNGIITIYSSDSRPTDDVMIDVYVNHHWFYIKNSDVRSKATLFQIIKLIDLVSVLPPQYQGPSLTLPG